MTTSLRRLSAWLATGPNRIALSTALRGTLATVAPLAVLPPLGLDALAHLAVIGALGTSMSDVGGPYRSRLAAMAFLAAAGSALLYLGMQASATWWVAAPLMFAIALGAGLIRAIGQGGIALGINTTVAFLVGLSLGDSGADLVSAAGYGIGAVWTIVVALAFWQLRPYRRLEQELASAWEAVARLVAAAAAGEEEASVVARRRREQRIAAAHYAARAAIERARDAIGEMRAGTEGPGTSMAQLVVLLSAVSRIGAAAVTLGESEATPAAGPAALSARHAALAELEQVCRAIARVLLAGKGDVDTARLRERIAGLASLGKPASADAAPPADLLAFAQAMRHVVNADEALTALFGQRRRLPDLLRLPLTQSRPRRRLGAMLGPHLTPNSAIFRHAVRVAIVTAIGTAIIIGWHLQHGIWLPMTSLVVLQPEYGGTITRALERTGGTLAGAIIAGVLLATLHGTAAFDVAIAVLLFATFALIRRRYGYAIVFLTPLIILLIAPGAADPWRDLADRVVDTLIGAALALAAVQLLWPQWERERLPERLARAVTAQRHYLSAVLAAMTRPAPAERGIAVLQREAEIELGNADAAFQRMMGEPTRQRGRVAQGFTLVVYIHRLCRHTIALALDIGAVTAPEEALGALRRLIDRALDDVAAALAEGRSPAPRPDFDAPLAALRSGLDTPNAESAGAAAARLVSQIVSDVTALHAAVSGR
jgi:uncharacterized membrane protein YccC